MEPNLTDLMNNSITSDLIGLDAPDPAIPTGNEYVSLPDVDPVTGALHSVGLVSVAARGILEFVGSSNDAWMRPYLQVTPPPGVTQPTESSTSKVTRLDYWLPSWQFSRPGLRWTLTLCAPLAMRGFFFLFELKNDLDTTQEVKIGLQGNWAFCRQRLKQSRPIEGVRALTCTKDNLKSSPIIPLITGELRPGLPMLSFALTADDPYTQGTIKIDGQDEARRGKLVVDTTDEREEEFRIPAGDEAVARWQLERPLLLEPHAQVQYSFYAGFGQDREGAEANVNALRRQGSIALLGQARTWLREHTLQLNESIHRASRLGLGKISAPDPLRLTSLNSVLNLNSFFNYFYATARALDNDELIMLSSRSPLSRNAATFSAHDALMWSFPSILQIDRQRARQLLRVLFTRYIAAAGFSEAYIDGSILNPEIVLDNVAAYLIALEYYVDTTSDAALLQEPSFGRGIDTLLLTLWSYKLEGAMLFRSDSPGLNATLPVSIYTNVLTWRMLTAAAKLKWHLGDQPRSDALQETANELRRAIWQYGVVATPIGQVFAGSVDTQGHHLLFDMPERSLQTLARLKFCDVNDPVFQATLHWIASAHNPHYYNEQNHPGAGNASSAYPSTLDLAHRLLATGDASALVTLRQISLDGGIACESFSGPYGRSASGRAAAPIAGYLALALNSVRINLDEEI